MKLKKLGFDMTDDVKGAARKLAAEIIRIERKAMYGDLSPVNKTRKIKDELLRAHKKYSRARGRRHEAEIYSCRELSIVLR